MADRKERLAEYDAKRDFSKTGEPSGKLAARRSRNLAFLVQKHAARRLHYDLRLEWDGALLSWAVTRGPSDDPSQKRLAVRTEDHPLSYGDFEGTIPKGEYGGGTVMLWDRGTWQPLHDPDEGLAAGKLHFIIDGERMHGGWALVRMGGKAKGKRENWLLIKERDHAAGDDPDRLTEDFQTSVKTGRAMDEIAADKAPKKIPSKKRTVKAPERNPSPPKKRRLKNPDFRKPQLATLVSEAPEGEDWLHETKFDGYRCLVSIGKDGARFHTRSGLDWTEKFADLAGAFDGLDCASALIDGEVMARDTNGGSAFSALQKVLKEGGGLAFYAFDLLTLDGKDQTKKPLTDRKAALETLLAALTGKDARVNYSHHISGNGAEILKRICAAGGEGIVSKKADAPYRGMRTRAWRKVKCTRRREFVVGGFSPSSKRGRAFASLLVGEFSGGRFLYRGRVGTGFSEEDLEALAAAMKDLQRKKMPFETVPAEIARQARWSEPKLVVEIDYSEFTADCHIRHGVFLGLREDKRAARVTQETETMQKTEAAAKVAGIGISNPDREIFPAANITKGDLARYYEAAGQRMIDIVRQRPFSLVRCPDGLSGDCFYQKHAAKGFPSQVRTVAIAEKSGKIGDYLTVASPAGLVAAAQMGTIEFHIWGAKTDDLEKPDRMIFDLDPGDGVAFAEVRQAAFDIHHRLSTLGLSSSAMVTGGKGIHVVVQMRRTLSWETLTIFSRTLATLLAKREPDRFVATMSKAKRKGRIFIDWLRNERGSTAIAPYSVRAREGAPVAVPVTWEELKTLKAANGFSIGDMAKRLDRPCPYLEAGKDLQTITKATIAKLEEWASD